MRFGKIDLNGRTCYPLKLTEEEDRSMNLIQQSFRSWRFDLTKFSRGFVIQASRFERDRNPTGEVEVGYYRGDLFFYNDYTGHFLGPRKNLQSLVESIRDRLEKESSNENF